MNGGPKGEGHGGLWRHLYRQVAEMPADKRLADLEDLRDLTLDAIGRVMKKV